MTGRGKRRRVVVNMSLSEWNYSALTQMVYHSDAIQRLKDEGPGNSVAAQALNIGSHKQRHNEWQERWEAVRDAFGGGFDEALADARRADEEDRLRRKVL